MNDQLTPEEIEQLRVRSRESIGDIPVTWRELNCLLQLHDERERLRNLHSKDVTREHVETIESEIGYRLDPYDIASSVRVIVASLDKTA